MLLDPKGIPTENDSPDFTEEEATGALLTGNSSEFVQALEEAIRPLVRPNVGATIQNYDLRRRNKTLYCRTRIAFDGEPDKVLVFQVDWLQNG
jgi:hypothetical protein